MRRMSFSLTKDQFLDGSKTVTRRLGWWWLMPGDRVLAVEKCMGLKKGEKQVILGEIEIVSVRREVLMNITQEDVVKEGFPDLTPLKFVHMFGKHMKVPPTAEVMRIEFRRV